MPFKPRGLYDSAWYREPVAQRIVHPNETRSAAFIAPTPKALMMIDFAKKVLEGYWPKPADQFPPYEREDLGSCVLSYGDVFIAFRELCDGGGCYTFNEMAKQAGLTKSICECLAITTIEWAKHVEEWT